VTVRVAAAPAGRHLWSSELAAVINASGLPDLEKIKAVMNQHGLIPAPTQK